jgi:hypothetical protein
LQWLTLVNKLGGMGLLPVVVFCFSKKKCDACVDGLTTLDLTSNADKAEIHTFCERALARLNPGDRKLPQVRSHLYGNQKANRTVSGGFRWEIGTRGPFALISFYRIAALGPCYTYDAKVSELSLNQL